jgi:benzoyl-CoA reductase/2-hydroxyglutaryl-CoA dehydratase subunit BcrC/BadD/HgdB
MKLNMEVKEMERGKTEMVEPLNSLEIMKHHYLHRDAAALKWKQDGGKVVGCVGTSIPEEIIMAAGCLPVQVTGDPDVPPHEGDRYMEDTFCPYVRSIHNLFLTGRYEFLDLAIFPHGTDSVKRCYFYLWTEKHDFEPDLKIPPLSVFDILHTRSYVSSCYVRGRMEAFKEELERFSGTKITDSAIARSIEICNENRRLLKRVAELRRSDPPLISGMEALQIIGSSFFMPKEEHNRLLADFLEGSHDLPARDGARLFVSGSIMDNTQFYELVESCNAVVVSEDISTGNRYSDNLVDTTMDPLDALTERYHTKSHEGRMPPMDDLVKYTVHGVKESKAQGVVFFYLQWDDSHTWNYPSQKAALDKINIPSVSFEMQAYKLEGPEQLRTRLETLVDMVQGGA